MSGLFTSLLIAELALDPGQFNIGLNPGVINRCVDVRANWRLKLKEPAPSTRDSCRSGQSTRNLKGVDNSGFYQYRWNQR